MNCADKIRYDRIFQQVMHKVGESSINCIKILYNAQAFSVLVRKNYSENQIMHIFLYNFCQGGKYSAQIYSHQAELKRKRKFTDKKYVSISSWHTDYLNIDSGSGFGKTSERENFVQTKCTFCIGANHSAEKKIKSIRKEKEKSRATGD